MDQTTEERREAALQLLGAIVTQNYEAGRRSLAATLKPTLKARTADGFDEKELGYETGFREFLRAATERRIVELHPAPKGPDLEVVPFGRPTLPATAAPQGDATTAHPAASPNHVRRDLWQAFTDWRDGWVRLFDKAAGTAVMFPREASPLEPSDAGEARSRWSLNPAQYVEIEPIGLPSQLAWMQEFARTQVKDEGVAMLLQFALTHERPVREFARAVQSRPELNREWRRFRLQRVVRIIDDWMKQHDINVPVLSAPAVRPAPQARSGGSSVAAERSDVRQRLHEALDRMPEGELLRISIPVEYLFPR
ncbi:MAG: UPF0158 family protein [Solirubrobacteraceae bacterium]